MADHSHNDFPETAGEQQRPTARAAANPGRHTGEDPLAPLGPDEDHGDSDPDSASADANRPPQPSVTPTPADPWSDRQVYSTATASTAVGIVAGLIAIRWLWKHRKRRRQTP